MIFVRTLVKKLFVEVEISYFLVLFFVTQDLSKKKFIDFVSMFDFKVVVLKCLLFITEKSCCCIFELKLFLVLRIKES